jgi:hypothetical protein
MVVTTLTRASSSPNKPVVILGAATAASLDSSSLPPMDFWHSSSARCAEAVYGQAQVGPSDINCAQIYDNFTPNVLFTLEGFGFCQQGESGSFVSRGTLGLNGHLPTNTSGGHLSESYLQGWSLNVEAVRQLRGDAGDRQVPSVKLVQYMSAAPLCGSVIYALG